MKTQEILDPQTGTARQGEIRMLDQLIESRNHLMEKRRRSGFLLSTFTIVFAVFSFGIVYSLFNSNLAMASSGLDISTLVSPVSVPAEAPEPPPIQHSEPKLQNQVKAVNNLQTRIENIQRSEESPVKPPETVSLALNQKLSRPNEAFKIGSENTQNLLNNGDGVDRGERGGGRRIGSGENNALVIKPPVNSEPIEKDMPPVIKTPTPKPTPAVKPIIKNEGIINGKAINLIKPQYPAAAKSIRAAGSVNVQVLIDEEGNVTSANAVSGHPLLRPVSEQAARASKFSPTFLSRQKVKVTGVIVYNFIVQ
jgi:TonB family protein